jgi:hypothetical protein
MFSHIIINRAARKGENSTRERHSNKQPAERRRSGAIAQRDPKVHADSADGSKTGRKLPAGATR